MQYCGRLLDARARFDRQIIFARRNDRSWGRKKNHGLRASFRARRRIRKKKRKFKNMIQENDGRSPSAYEVRHDSAADSVGDRLLYGSLPHHRSGRDAS